MRAVGRPEMFAAHEPTPARPEGVVGLILLLAVTGSALAVFAGVPDPDRLPVLPSWGAVEILARSPNPPLDSVVRLVVLVAWVVWAWAVLSLCVEFALAVAEQGPARGAAWLRGARAAADRLTLPLARRAVAAAVVLQLATRPALPALAFASEPSAFVVNANSWRAPVAGYGEALVADVGSDSEPDADVVHHVVQPRETLWSIAERYYGTGEEFDRVIDANVGKQMPDGRLFDRAGLIYPGWTLDVPLPSPVIEEREGSQWYVVQRGDTLSGIAARLLGDPSRYNDLFELNVGARLGEGGPSLSSPDLIWPDLRLRLPFEVVPASEPATQPESTVEAEPEPTPPAVVAPPTTVEPAIQTATAEPLATTSASDYAEPTDDSLAVPTPAPTPPAEPLAEPIAPSLSPADVPQVDTATVFVVAGAAAALAGLGLAGARVVRRRRRADRAAEPSLALEQGFALTDPARIMGQRLAGESEAATEIANRLARSFATVLAASLSESEQLDVFGKVALVAVRHGLASTTCVLSAPPVARAHLLRHLEPAVGSAFGDAVDIDGVVTHDGDLFIQIVGIDRRRLRVAVVDEVPAEQRLWPEPLLVPLGLLYDRQTLYANWHGLSHVLVAAPMGQAAETTLVGLIASLAARRPPAELALVTLASPRTLPRELLSLPHQLMAVVDPDDRDALRSVLEQVRQELDRRAISDSRPAVDLIILVRELALVARQALDLLDPLLRDGPRYRIRVLAASEQPAAELTVACPGLGAFRTRLVLQTADEDASQALLGAAGAEELPTGGSMLLRLEGRTPLRAHGFRVAPDHLARLVALMEHQHPKSPSAPVPSNSTAVSVEDANEAVSESATDTAVVSNHAVDDCHPPDGETAQMQNGVASIAMASEPQVNSDSDPAKVVVDELTLAAADTEKARPRSDLLRQFDQAPLRLRCFGTLGVRLAADRQVWPSSEAVEETGWELVVLLGIHPAAGIQVETLADTIWDEDTPPDPGSVLRKRRRRLRQELKRLIPELDLDPLPTDPKGRVYRLDPRVIASDVHQFVELAGWAKSLPRSDAIDAYEEALALYGGDLLESVAVPTYPWLYDGAAIATSLRPDYRRLQEDVRLRLADLYATGTSEEELGRAFDLYTELTAERPDDDRRWISLLRVQGRRGDAMGLEASIRRLRTALVELGQAEKPETAHLPLSVQRVLEEVQNQLRASGQTAVG